jgi:exodeoxyribonuclease V beta subunit
MAVEKEFDVMNTDLQGRNLIEASAGTGKTYSVAILVLRLVIEKKIPVEKILMVTFTKAAVAELESRIRKFVRMAYRYSAGKGEADNTIRGIIDTAGKKESLAELKKAVQSLDELSVMTIHSFCEQSLMQYPFETGQSFRFDIATDISDIRDLVVNDYWRKKINTLDPDLFTHFSEFLTRKMVQDVLDKALDGKDYIFGGIDEDEVLNQIRRSIEDTENAWEDFKNHIILNFNAIIGRQPDNQNAMGLIEKFSSSPSAFIDEFVKRCGKNYIVKHFPEENRLCSIYLDQKSNLDELSRQFVYNLFKLAISDLTNRVEAIKSRRQVIDFDDQIKMLHEAVEKGTVNSVLSSRYDAVFIDEFQDTDKLQYEIFNGLYSEKILFYIGDPKQSIYGWRKADIATYKVARDSVDTVHKMNLNFRSTTELINALNSFFSIENPFSDPEIVYRDVEPGLHDLGLMTENNVPVSHIDIYGFDKKAEIGRFVVSEIRRLLSDGDIQLNGNDIKPSDIAIIVRKNKEGRAIKKLLSKVNIPAVTIDDSKVMSSDEAGIIRYLMDAVIQPDRGALNRVLLNPCFDTDSESVQNLEEETHLENFRELRKIWHDSGVYNMLFRFYYLYNVRHHCLGMGVEGQRILTNFHHIAEILHQAEMKNKYTPNELLVWSQRVQDDEQDEYEQRIESQDDAVQVTTIHKCKGLTYKVVFAPHLDLKVEERDIYEFRENGRYWFTHQPTDTQMQLWREQIEQENRRLIYVTLTRAQYKVYVCVNNANYYSGSSLKKFPVQSQSQWDGGENGGLPAPLEKAELTKFAAKPVPGIIIKNPFGIHSFSALSNAHHSAPFEKTDLPGNENFDRFIFQELGRGANVGTALHSIFERLDFSRQDSWLQTIHDASKYYPNIIKEKDDEKHTESNIELIHQMVQHVMKAEINIQGKRFRLCEIDNERKLPELEFLFSVDKVNRQVINKYLGDDAKIGGDTDIEGLMTGFMDLVFEHEGKYYILDWKSNHLGNGLENYNPAAMNEAMTGNNYHLQYLIYTVALKRWLEMRIKDFDFDTHFGGVIYVFLRGVREEGQTGIYTNRPGKQQIDELDGALRGVLQPADY